MEAVIDVDWHYKKSQSHNIRSKIFPLATSFVIYEYKWDMWQYLYGIGYGLIPNAKFCKQLLC